MEISTIGLDLAKSVFQVHAITPSRRAVVQVDPKPIAGE